MTDYTPKFVTEEEVRNFFSPPLTTDDISSKELLLKIEAVETYIITVFFQGSTPSKDDVRIPALLLVASQIVQNPKISRKYNVLVTEKLGDYSYRISDRYGKIPYNAYAIWRDMALSMLKMKAGRRFIRIDKANKGLL